MRERKLVTTTEWRRAMRLLQKPVALVVALMVTLGGMSACDDDPVQTQDVTRGELVARFEATTIRVDPAGAEAPIDVLEGLGGELEIVLNADGTTTGHLFVPGADEGGGDLDESLAGRFTFDAGTGEVTFEQDADTFVRDLSFHAVWSGDAIELRADETLGTGDAYEVVLRRM
jgi:hypothetical protein